MDTTNTKTITYGNEADALAGMIPIDIIRNILSYIDFDEYKKIHKNKMKKVLYELKNKNQDYINDLIGEHIGGFITDVYFNGYNEDDENHPWQPSFNLINDIHCYFIGHSSWNCYNYTCGCSDIFKVYVNYVLKENPNSNIVTELQKIETSPIYCDEDEWEQYIDDLVTITLVDEIKPELEQEEEEEEEIIQSGLEFIHLMYDSDDKNN